MAQIGHFCYRLNYTTQHEIDWKSGILLQANASFTQDQRDTELAQERCFGSGQGDTQQQVGLRFAAMKQDG